MKEGGEAAPEADNAAAENPPANDEEQPLVKSEKAPTEVAPEEEERDVA
jgi:hypothetical protein